ncbi:hypothetical protein LTR53_008109 [Teratosphaeriaceae sp. CCFEE 6253]|nr:hypothetical protein LTR53_008109 [Teratosphaeriaceae sp. CCFEE 6253]
MPPKRKSTGPRTAPSRQSSNSQATLSFHGKQNKVTKPSVAPSAKTTKKDPALVEEIVKTDIEIDTAPEDPEESPAASAAPPPKAEPAAQTPPSNPHITPAESESVLGPHASASELGATGGTGAGWLADEEAQARAIPETQIKRYWRQKEAERLAPRVHQEDLTVHEKVLREWDMSGQFGPCIGIARLKRWKRANLLGLKPPIEVLAVVLKEQEAGNVGAQRAYVDQLMTARLVET